MTGHCFSSVFTQKAFVVGNCVQQTVLRILHAPRLASFDDWCVGVAALVLALVCALTVLAGLILLENVRRHTPRRYT
jgi:hypothetical protein